MHYELRGLDAVRYSLHVRGALFARLHEVRSLFVIICKAATMVLPKQTPRKIFPGSLTMTAVPASLWEQVVAN